MTQATTRTPRARDMSPGNLVTIQLEPSKSKLPLGIGVEIPGGRTVNLIPGGSRLPLKTTKSFSTATSFQTAAEFHILLGERPLARDNESLARIRVRNVKWSSAGEPKIDLIFEIDENGLMTISTRNQDRKHDRVLVGNVREQVSQEEMEQALRNMKESYADDKLRRDSIEEMLAAYQLLSDAYEVYAVAKRKMAFPEKRHYRALRKRIGKALEVMPPDATEESLAELKEASQALKHELVHLEKLKRQVENWWK